MLSQGGCSECSESSDDAANNNDVADDEQFQGMPSGFSVQTVSVLREGIEDIIMKAEELIVEASIMSCSQIDSSKFIREPLEQLLPKDIKRIEEMQLLITARDKDVHIECIIETEVFVMRYLLHRETMDFFNVEMYNETVETKEQMHSIQIEENSDDMWRSPKTFHYASNIHML